MKWKTFVIGYALALAILVFARQHTSPTHSSGFTTVLDLTHTVGGNTPGYESKEKSGLRVKTIATPGKNGYLAREITLPEHFGAHIDVPAHIANGMWAVNEIPVERLVARVVGIDVRSYVVNNTY